MTSVVGILFVHLLIFTAMAAQHTDNQDKARADKSKSVHIYSY